MNLNLNLLFNYKISNESLKATMNSYASEIAAEEKTINEIREIKKRYEKHATEVLLVPYEKILKESTEYESLLVLAQACSEIQRELAAYNRLYKDFLAQPDTFSGSAATSQAPTPVELKRIKTVDAFNKDTLTLLQSCFKQWTSLSTLDLDFLASGKSTFHGYMNNLLEGIFRNFETQNLSILTYFLKQLNLPISKVQSQSWSTGGHCNGVQHLPKDLRDVVPAFMKRLVEIDGAMHALIPDRMFFMRVFSEGVIASINFHFLGEKETNEPSKPEWFFQYLQQIFESNSNGFCSLFKRKDEPCIQVFMQNFFQRVCLHPVLIRFTQDREIFLADTDLLVNFVQNLEIFEMGIEKTAISLAQFPTNKQETGTATAAIGKSTTKADAAEKASAIPNRLFPYIYEKILLTQDEGILNGILLKEYSVFNEKIIQEMKKVDIQGQTPKQCSEKHFEVFPIVEDYTILFSKIVKKYGLITDVGLREKVKPFFEEKFFNSFMNQISAIFSQVFENTDEITIQLVEYFRKVYNILREYQSKNPLDGGVSEMKILKEFKKQQIEPAIAKFADPIIKSGLKEVRKLVNSTYFKLFTHPRQIEESSFSLEDLKANLLETLIYPLSNLLNVLQNQKSIKFVISRFTSEFDDFIVTGIMKSYTKFSIYGIEFLVHDILAHCLHVFETSIEANIPQERITKSKERLVEIEKACLMDKNKLQLILNPELDTVLTQLHFKTLKREDLLILEKINMVKV